MSCSFLSMKATSLKRYEGLTVNFQRWICVFPHLWGWSMLMSDSNRYSIIWPVLLKKKLIRLLPQSAQFLSMLRAIAYAALPMRKKSHKQLIKCYCSKFLSTDISLWFSLNGFKNKCSKHSVF